MIKSSKKSRISRGEMPNFFANRFLVFGTLSSAQHTALAVCFCEKSNNIVMQILTHDYSDRDMYRVGGR